MQGQILKTETSEFGNAQAGSETQVQHGTVPDAGPIGGLGRVQKRLDLVGREMAHQTRIGLLHRNRENASNLLQSRRQAMLHEVHE
jgi:hypothetical protein